MGFFDKVVNFFKAGTPDDSTAANPNSCEGGVHDEVLGDEPRA